MPDLETVPDSLANLVNRLIAASGTKNSCYKPMHTQIPAAHYTAAPRFEQELKMVADSPRIAAHSSELGSNNMSLAVSLGAISILLSRDEQGHIHAFLNSCRHRGMQLLEDGGCRESARIVCPYHAWTYRLNGELKAIPHEDAFDGIDKSQFNLVRLPVVERHGFIWVITNPDSKIDLPRWLGDLSTDLDYFQLADHAVYRQSTGIYKANWKLLMDAFLEAYHVPVLHRKTVGPFFDGSLAVSDQLAPHTRSVVARKELKERSKQPDFQPDLRHDMTFTHVIFPNHVLVMHPDYISQLTITPVASDQLQWRHRMLIPAVENRPDREEHWRRSFDLIENGVFVSEDLHSAEATQRGLATGANQFLNFGGEEHQLADFHRYVEQAINGTDFN